MGLASKPTANPQVLMELKLLTDQQMPESVPLFGARQHHFVPDFQHQWLSVCIASQAS
jgi:hypothetical protein